MNIIILAGGGGTRLWPLGRKHNPKQFFPRVGKQPLVRETYDRFAKVYGSKKIFFSVTKDLLPQLKKLFPRLPASQFIVEPSRRDTAPAMGFVAAYLASQSPDEPMVFVPSDHFIADIKQYIECFKIGERAIKETGKMLDIGIVATFPSTVLGYTKLGKLYKKIGGVELYHFAGHTEKPDLATATAYLASGQYLWHGNYYMWTPRKFLEAIKKYAPEMHETLESIQRLLGRRNSGAIERLYNTMEKISFDYPITEKIKKNEVIIIKGTFGWSDVGAWDVLHNQLSHLADGKGNVLRGDVVHLDTKNCLLYAYPKRMMAAVGLENIVVIDTDDAVLVCAKDKAQEVKKLFPLIEEKGMEQYL